MKAILLSLLAGVTVSFWVLLASAFSHGEPVKPGPVYRGAWRGTCDLQPPVPMEQERLPEPVAEPPSDSSGIVGVADERGPGEVSTPKDFLLRDLSPSMVAGLAKAEAMKAAREYGLTPEEILRRKTTALALAHGLKLDPESWQYNRLWMYVEHCKEWGYTLDEAVHAALPGACPDPCPSMEW